MSHIVTDASTNAINVTKKPTSTSTTTSSSVENSKRPSTRVDTTLEGIGRHTGGLSTLAPSDHWTTIQAKINNVATRKVYACNDVNDCSSNEMCIRKKCIKICDRYDTNNLKVDCVQGICL